MDGRACVPATPSSFFPCSINQASDERIATLMSAVNWYRAGVLENPTKPVFMESDSEGRKSFEKMWRDLCYKRAHENRVDILTRLQAAQSQSALVSKVWLPFVFLGA